MRITIPLIWTLAGISSAAALAVALPAAMNSRSAARRELGQLERDRGPAQQIAAARASAPAWAARPRPWRGLARSVSAVLESSGLPPSALSSLSPEAVAAVSDQAQLGAKRQRASLSLTGVTLPGLGRFLEAWRSAEPAWTITSIDIGPERSAAATAPAEGGDLPLRALVRLEAFYVDTGGTKR